MAALALHPAARPALLSAEALPSMADTLILSDTPIPVRGGHVPHAICSTNALAYNWSGNSAGCQSVLLGPCAHECVCTSA